MPLIQVKGLEGVWTSAQKTEMIGKLTEALVSVAGDNLRPVVWVMIDEVKSGDWGIGGKPLTTADAKAFAVGKQQVG